MANALNEHEWDYLIRPLLVYDAQVLDPSEDAPGSPNTVRGQGPPGGPPYDYPVVHGTLGGMFYFYMALLLAFGKSAPAIKAAYAALHTLSVVMIYAIARAVEPDARKKAMTGLAAALIAVSAPFFNKDPFVSANPEEVVSLALFLPVVWLYVKRGVATSGIVYGFLCFVVTAVKVYPGILLAGLLGMDALRRIIFSRERRVERWLFHFVTVWLAASTVQAMRTNAFPLLEYWFLEKACIRTSIPRRPSRSAFIKWRPRP
ncbi:MAG: hypothetical protein M5R36_27945 [Deltaproteobacteria bacterium]|nr:hypothetical protein [Deltaproteobacteria bacterium]